MAERLTRRGIVVLISDFYEEPDQVRDAVGLLRAGGSDVLAFHLLDPAELKFPFEAAATFEDLESGDRVPVVPEDLRDRYRDLVRGPPGRALGTHGGDAGRLRNARHHPAARLRAARLPGAPPRAPAHPMNPFAFLVPAFLAGLAAIAIPVLVHLRHRERKEPVRFPSLMFLTGSRSARCAGSRSTSGRSSCSGCWRWRCWCSRSRGRSSGAASAPLAAPARRGARW